MKIQTSKYDFRLNPCYQVDFQAAASGKRVAQTKRRIRFRFGFSNKEAIAEGLTGKECRGEEHEVVIIWSLTSGKRLVIADGQEVHFSLGNRTDNKFETSWTMQGGHLIKVIAYAAPPLFPTPGFRQFDLLLDGCSYFKMAKIYELGTSTANKLALTTVPTTDVYNNYSLPPQPITPDNERPTTDFARPPARRELVETPADMLSDPASSQDYLDSPPIGLLDQEPSSPNVAGPTDEYAPVQAAPEPPSFQLVSNQIMSQYAPAPAAPAYPALTNEPHDVTQHQQQQQQQQTYQPPSVSQPDYTFAQQQQSYQPPSEPHSDYSFAQPHQQPTYQQLSEPQSNYGFAQPQPTYQQPSQPQNNYSYAQPPPQQQVYQQPSEPQNNYNYAQQQTYQQPSEPQNNYSYGQQQTYPQPSEPQSNYNYGQQQTYQPGAVPVSPDSSASTLDLEQAATASFPDRENEQTPVRVIPTMEPLSVEEMELRQQPPMSETERAMRSLVNLEDITETKETPEQIKKKKQELLNQKPRSKPAPPTAPAWHLGTKPSLADIKEHAEPKAPAREIMTTHAFDPAAVQAGMMVVYGATMPQQAQSYAADVQPSYYNNYGQQEQMYAAY